MSEKYKFNNSEGIYFVTSTIVFWIDLFTRPAYSHILISALRHCQNEKGLIIYAYCIMPSHIHLIVGTTKEPLSSILRDFKKFTSREIIKEIHRINESRKEWLLRAFEKAGEKLRRISHYKVWQDGNHPIELESNKFLEQKVDYIHNNPVAAEIVDEAENYLYSSARDYVGRKGLLEVVLIG